MASLQAAALTYSHRRRRSGSVPAPKQRRTGPKPDKLTRCLAVFSLDELRAIVARWRVDFPQLDSCRATAARAIEAGLAIDVLSEAEMLRVCDAVPIAVSARTRAFARAAIISARLEKFRRLTFAGEDDEDATSMADDDEDEDDDGDGEDNVDVAPALRPADEPPAAPQDRCLVPFDEPPAAREYWAKFENTRDPKTGATISRAARVANRVVYARHRNELVRGQYVVYDDGHMISRCTDSWSLGYLLLKSARAVSPNYFWTVVGAEDAAVEPAHVFFCDVVFERGTGIIAEMRPHVVGVRLATRGDEHTAADVDFLIDTGSQVSIISAELSRRLHLDDAFVDSFRTIKGAVGHAQLCRCHWLMASFDQSGDVPFDMPHPFLVCGQHNILGMDVLHYFDFRLRGHQPVTLRPMQRIDSLRTDLAL